MRSNTHYIGRAGEYAVASQLLMREIPVYFPAVDDGVDLIAGGRIRIQVKTSRRHDYRLGGYVFTLGKRKPKDGHKQYWLTIPDWSEIDYLVCCGIDDAKFWIVPSRALLEFPKVQSLILGTGHHKQVDHDRMEQLLKSGLSKKIVAAELGVSEMCVYEHSRGRRPSEAHGYNLARAADRFEGDWDAIVQDLGLTSQVDESVEALTEV